jgi:hypothetical protein
MLFILWLGLLAGVRHALEPDHLAAVGTLVTDGRAQGARLGAWWGLGHTLSLVTMAGALTVLQASLTQRMEGGFELLVAVMLVALGLRGLVRAAMNDRVPHVHVDPRVTHGLLGHVTLGVAVPPTLLVGVVHGLAGSGELMALAMARMPTSGTRLGFAALFGVGSMAGMAALTGILGVPMARLAMRPTVGRGLSFLGGAISLGLGLWWGWPHLTP